MRQPRFRARDLPGLLHKNASPPSVEKTRVNEYSINNYILATSEKKWSHVILGIYVFFCEGNSTCDTLLAAVLWPVFSVRYFTLAIEFLPVSQAGPE